MSDYIVIKKEMILKLRDLGVTNAWETLLYGKILSMSSDTGYCIASNRYFANLLGVEPRSVQRYLSELSKLKIIKTYEQKIGSHTESRKIYPQIWEETEPEEVEEDTDVVEEEEQTSGAVQKKEKAVPKDPEREKKREENLNHFKSLDYGGIMSNDLIPEVCEVQYAREEYEDETIDEKRERLMKFLTGGFVRAKKELAEELVDTVIAGNGRL